MAENPVVEGEVRALRQEVAALRDEQRELLKAVEEMSRVFRSLALQLGIASEPAGRIAHEAGLGVVMDRCTLIEHERLFGGRHG